MTPPPPFDSVYEFLAAIRRRSALYLGRKSACALHALLCGVSLGEELHRIPEAERVGGTDTDFERWVEERYNPTRLTTHSFGLAEIVAGDDAAGLDL